MKKANKTLAGIMGAAAVAAIGGPATYFGGQELASYGEAQKAEAEAAQSALASPAHIKELRDQAYMECYNSASQMKPDLQSYKIGVSIPACMISQPDARMRDASVEGLNKEAILTASVSPAFLTARASTLFSAENAIAEQKIESAERLVQAGNKLHDSTGVLLIASAGFVAGSMGLQLASGGRRRRSDGMKPSMA